MERRTKNGNRANGDKIAEREKISKRQIEQNNEIYILTIVIRKMKGEGMRVWKSWKGRRTKNGNHANMVIK